MLKLFTALGFTTSALAVRALDDTPRWLARLANALQRLGKRLTSRYSPTGLVASSTVAGEDLGGRKDFARGIASTLRSLDASKGAVVAVRGPWGSGKTSLMNLVVRELRASPGPLIVEANPWLSWNDHQPATLFAHLASQVRLDSPQLVRVVESMMLYADSVAVTTDRAPARTSLGTRRGTIDHRFYGRNRGASRIRPRASLKRALRKLPQPLIVAVDDIDRLPSEEARSVFRFVRLTARLPQLVYMMAFDRAVAGPLLAQETTADWARSNGVREITYDLPKTVRRLPPSWSQRVRRPPPLSIRGLPDEPHRAWPG